MRYNALGHAMVDTALGTDFASSLSQTGARSVTSTCYLFGSLRRGSAKVNRQRLGLILRRESGNFAVRWLLSVLAEKSSA